MVNNCTQIEEKLLSVPVTYQREWQDGFGVRGWKLDSSLDDPKVIAATAETGCRIKTSVLIHDILDHYVSGFPLSGHRNEAMALFQLASRTDSNPYPDYEQMVDEDLMQGDVSQESLRSFLPKCLVSLLPKELLSRKEIVKFLCEKVGREVLRRTLVSHFFELGQRGATMAYENWSKFKLDYEKRSQIGLCLQNLLTRGDEIVIQQQYVKASGLFMIGNQRCELHIFDPHQHFISEHV
jgi:hypothetical protein